jgi:hypothetical protein
MKRTRHTSEQIVKNLREAEAMLAAVALSAFDTMVCTATLLVGAELWSGLAQSLDNAIALHLSGPARVVPINPDAHPKTLI